MRKLGIYGIVAAIGAFLGYLWHLWVNHRRGERLKQAIRLSNDPPGYPRLVMMYDGRQQWVVNPSHERVVMEADTQRMHAHIAKAMYEEPAKYASPKPASFRPTSWDRVMRDNE